MCLEALSTVTSSGNSICLRVPSGNTLYLRVRLHLRLREETPKRLSKSGIPFIPLQFRLVF
jgi:hypothetical protein